MKRYQDTGTVRLGVDFGVSTTVIAVGVPGRKTVTLALPGISREFFGDPAVHAIPSLVQYEGGAVVRRGDAVERGGAAGLPGTARWMRRYLCNASPVQIPAGDGRMVRSGEAAEDFLAGILDPALRQFPGAGLVFALPTGAPAGYADLLRRVARQAGAVSCRVVPEYRAAAAGYGYTPVPGEPFVVITFAETEPEVAVVMQDDPETDPETGGPRVLARASGSIGCRAIDTRIGDDILGKFRLPASDPRAARLAPAIRFEAARLRERLPRTGEETVSLTDTVSKKTFTATYTAADFDRVLAGRDVIVSLQDCIGRALSAVQVQGAGPIGAVLLLGCGGALPAVQDAVRSAFPGAMVHAGHPLDAVARGAAEAGIPARAQDRIACSYALRYWDAAVQEHHYRFLVHSGTRYPSAGQVARVVISAAWDGQTHLGIPLYELGGDTGRKMPGIELVSDIGGGVRLAGPAQDAGGTGPAVHANERSPTLLVADPPARKGEPRFECTFSLDAERNLCLSARDLVTGRFVKLNAPVHRLN